MLEKPIQHRRTQDIGAISWWSWRPGIRPRMALLVGSSILCAALLLLGIGISGLILVIEYGGKPVLLQHTSIVEIVIGTATFLLLGCALLPYPAMLISWAWRDLHTGEGRQQKTLLGQVVGLRKAVQTRARRPGMIPRPTSTWYGVALQPLVIHKGDHIVTFAISQEMYEALSEGSIVRIFYSPHIHYVYKLELPDE